MIIDNNFFFLQATRDEEPVTLRARAVLTGKTLVLIMDDERSVVLGCNHGLQTGGTLPAQSYMT